MNKKVLKIILVSTGLVLGLIVILFSTLELTSKPDFCSTCHIMEPYVEGWKSSTHSEVTCTDCHFPPGFKSKLKGKFTAISMVVNYFTGVYKKSKPWAEITDESCLRSGCHEQRLLKGKVLFKEGIIFDHKPHLTKLRREKKLRCTSCHSQIVQGDHMTVTESTCFLCHFKNHPDDAKISSCTLCHEPPVASDSINVKYDHTFALSKEIDCKKCHGEMQVGDGAVPVERCSSCHAEVGKIERYNDTSFIHKNHVTDHKVECQNCHLVIQHKSVSKSVSIMADCNSCHQHPHQSQLNLFTGTGGKGVPPHPNPMYNDGLNCQACHVFHQFLNGSAELGETLTAKAESCEMCHGGGYGRILNQWRELMKKKINRVEKSIGIVESEIARDTGADEKKVLAQKQFSDAEYNLQMVKNGNIVHNVAYSDELLLSAENGLKQALKIIGSKANIKEISIYSKLVPSECKNCHYGQEEITVEAFGINFSHNIHIMKNHLLCSKCHSNRTRHGELIMSRKDCLSCHHKAEEKKCGRCHELQVAVYSGDVDFSDDVTPDVMFEEDVTCRDCHENDDRVIQKANGDACISCHDDEYEETLTEWMDETRESLDSVSKLLLSINDVELKEDEQLKIDKIRNGVKSIREDGSFGAHNMELVSELIDEFNETIRGFAR